MIPKVDSAKHTGDFRPIAVSPVLLRTLHNILAKRVQQSVEFDKKQRAFISTDGCGGEHSHIPGNPKVEPADNPILLYGDDGHVESVRYGVGSCGTARCSCRKTTATSASLSAEHVQSEQDSCKIWIPGGDQRGKRGEAG